MILFSHDTFLFIVLSLFGYLCGSLPFGFWLSRWFQGSADIRHTGSGSTGATNVWRTAGKGAALLTLALDIFKGFAPTALALSLDIPGALWIGIFPVLGHIFPLFLQLKGGKGVASVLGVLLALSNPIGASLLLFWLFILSVTRYVSVASLSAAFVAPFICFLLDEVSLSLITLLLSLLLFWTHRGNIQRLIQGTEPRVGRKVRVA